MEISEEQIIATCQKGNLDSFVLLYDQYVEKIYNFVFYRTNHKEVAEDLTSQTFIQAMDKISTFNLEKGTFQAWLYAIARNNLTDYYRRQKPTDDLDAHQDLTDATNLQEETNRKLTYQQLQKLLQDLPDNTRELITMRLWDELSYAEISQITGKTEGSLKMQFSRAITSLQAYAHLLVLSLIFLKR